MLHDAPPSEGVTTMDYDKDQFLSDIFEALVLLPGDPMRQIDHAVNDVIAEHVKVLKRLAETHRQDLLGMTEERKQTGQPVATRWRV
jgi:hypothetical protein